MRTTKSIVLFIMLVSASASGQDASSVPIRMERNKTMVTVRIGSLSIPNIILDTGFGFDGLLIYNTEYLDSLDLSGAIEVRIPGAGSGEPSRGLMLDSASFHLGGIQMTNQRIILLTSNTFSGSPTNGVMGYSIFGHYATELNYDNGTMTLYPPSEFEVDDTWTPIPLYFKNNSIPWLDGGVVIEDEDPVPLSMYIDFAAGETIELLEKPEMKFPMPANSEKAYLGRGLSGDIYGKRCTISKLIIGPYTLQNVRAALAPGEVRSKQDNADAILGNASLRRFNLIFDYANKKLYVKPNSYFHDPY